MKRTFFLSTLLLVLAISTSWGAIPETISYQGVLTDATGVAVPDGNYTLAFRLYDASTNGTALWPETAPEIHLVPVKNGIFNVILGKMNPLTLPFDAPYWLGITVAGNSTELSPRTPLTATPYSLNARSVLGGSNVFPSSGNVSINGSLNIMGRRGTS